MKQNGRTKSRDAIFIASLLILAAVLYLFFVFGRDEGGFAVVTVDGVVTNKIPLDQNGDYELNGGSNVLRIENGASACRDDHRFFRSLHLLKECFFHLREIVSSKLIDVLLECHPQRIRQKIIRIGKLHFAIGRQQPSDRRFAAARHPYENDRSSKHP